MGYKIKSISVVLFAMLILVSCKNDSKESGDNFPESIHGVWQEEGWEDDDEFGRYFTSNEVGYWDYMGDEYDQKGDCYWNDIVGNLISRDGDKYRVKLNPGWVEEGEDDETVITIKLDGDMLTYIESGSESYEEVYFRDSRIVSSLTPECSFKVNSNSKMNKLQKLFK